MVAMAATTAGVFFVRGLAGRLKLIDTPNERSLHDRPVPRGGGLAFALIVPLLVYLANDSLTTLMITAMAASTFVAAVSLLDDLRGLSPLLRLATHLAGAMAVIAAGGVIHEVALPGGNAWHAGSLAIPLTMLWLVGMTNIYNFMDGIDGLAAGQAVIVATTAAAVSVAIADYNVGIAMAIMAGAATGFLLHNWAPARIFMGDVGSAFLGFWFAAWAVVSAADDRFPMAFWFAMMATFIADTTWTLIRRSWRGESLFTAHREHIYQRLVTTGRSHRFVTSLYLWITALICAQVYLLGGLRTGLASTMHSGGHFLTAELDSDIQISQAFSLAAEGFNRLDLNAWALRAEVPAQAQLKVRELGKVDDRIVAAAQLSVHGGEAGERIPLSFRFSPIVPSKGKTYMAEVSLAGTTEPSGLALFMTPATEVAGAAANGRALSADLVFSTDALAATTWGRLARLSQVSAAALLLIGLVWNVALVGLVWLVTRD